ncbi:MAG: hypothetical protein NTW73_02795 [Candidatus Parcubacteria bacterium]|nr:hypothetical protein [Candidatus Parcubacteria bacterium]
MNKGISNVLGAIILAIILMGGIGGYMYLKNKSPDIKNINNCNSDSDCVIVSEGFCGGEAAINKDHLDTWNKYLEYERIKHQDNIMCDPKFPSSLSDYEAKCINNKCVAIQIQNHYPAGDKCQIDSDCICTLSCPDCCGKVGQCWKCIENKCEIKFCDFQ